VTKPLLIKNGYVYDPLNRINGEKMDIAVKDGKIVEERGINPSEAKVIDAANKVIMPGGVDIHSHIAGYAINAGRRYRPEDGRIGIEPRTSMLRSGSGYSVPSTFVTGYRYAKMGWTTVCEPAMPPLLARHTHEELNDIPMIDTLAFTLLGNNWAVMRYLKEGDHKLCAAFVAWILRATKGYTIKMVNPGGTEAWHWGKNVKDLDSPVPHFNITPAEIIHGLATVNEMLRLPHSIHLHPNQLGLPGNFEIALESFEVSKDVKVGSQKGRNQVLHMTHAQFSAFGGDSWQNFESKADKIASYVNSHAHVTVDMGQVIPGETTTMTADGPLEYGLHRLTHLKWMNFDVELETGGGLVPFIYARTNPVNSVQWAIGLELALLIKNPFQVFLSTDHPNAGPFTRYPRVISWLMSRKAREEVLKKIHEEASRRSVIATLDREYSLQEIATVTRAGQAAILGLSDRKGHLGVSADADIAIYNLDPKGDLTPNQIELAFSSAAYTIKGGEIVVEDGKIVQTVAGQRFWVNSQVDEELEQRMMRDVSKTFAKYYTINMANFPVQNEYIPRSNEIKIDATHIT